MRTRVSILPALALLALAAVPAGPTPSPVPGVATATEALPSPVGPLSVERAEFSEFFCFFVVVDEGTGEASGYSGARRAVSTPGGPVAYRCEADLLFGTGVESAETFTRVDFFDFLMGPIGPCTVRVTPAGWGFANCTVVG